MVISDNHKNPKGLNYELHKNITGDTPVSESTAVISVSPFLITVPERGEDLQVRVSAPVTGNNLPIIVFSHGNGKSLDSYAPLVQYWAAHGFVVLQCTHLDSRRLRLDPNDQRTPLIWKIRVKDVKNMIDNLDIIETSISALKGRLDRSRIAAVGHSFGSQTTGMLLGARVIEPDGKLGEDMSDARVKAGVMLCPGGRGEDLSLFAAKNLPYLSPDYSNMTTPTLMVSGDKDNSPLSIRGPEWFTDAYFMSEGNKCLLTLFGAEHLLGGISGFDSAETTDENPERVAAVQYYTSAYLNATLYHEDSIWESARKELAESKNPQGKIECKKIVELALNLQDEKGKKPTSKI